jgi:1-acyl-sn-glycerol-3-phosphate acyltransferase
MIRLIFTIKFGAVMLILFGGSIVMLVTSIVTGFRAKRLYRETILATISTLSLRVFGIKVTVNHDRPLPQGQVVYIANHSSTIDIFVLTALRLPNTRFFLRGGLRKILPIGLIGYLVGNFWTVSQEYPERRRQIFSRAAGILRRSRESVFLSPEGERVTGGRIGHFNKGAFHLATDLKAPIVPIFISIPAEIDPGRGFNAKPGRVEIRIGEPIETRNWSLDELSMNREAVRRLYVGWNAARLGRDSDLVPSLAG